MPHHVLTLALAALGLLFVIAGALLAVMMLQAERLDGGTVADDNRCPDPGRSVDPTMSQVWHPEPHGHRFEGHNPDDLPALPGIDTRRPIGMGALILDLDAIHREEASHRAAQASRYDWQGGQTMAEYAVVLAVITLAAVLAMGALSGAISDALASMTGQL